MQSSLDYAGFAQFYGRSPIMRKIIRTHNCTIRTCHVLYTFACLYVIFYHLLGANLQVAIQILVGLID